MISKRSFRYNLWIAGLGQLPWLTLLGAYLFCRPADREPYFNIALATFVPIIIGMLLLDRWIRRFRKQAVAANFIMCPYCGYDLRGAVVASCDAAADPLVSCSECGMHAKVSELPELWKAYSIWSKFRRKN